MHRRARAALLVGLIGGAIGASPAHAQEFCVVCTDPDARYRCNVGGEPTLDARTSRGQMLCITELARTGGHASCSVRRAAAEPCEGEARTVMFPADLDAASTPLIDQPSPPMAPAQPVHQAAPDDAASPPVDAGVPPQQAPEETQGAGNAVGRAMQKSWDCVSSLFSNC